MANNSKILSRIHTALDSDSDGYVIQWKEGLINVRRGASAPASSLGKDGELYIDTSDNSLYAKNNGSWFLVQGGSDVEFGYQDLFPGVTSLQRYPTTHDTGHNHFASAGSDIRWYASQETVFDTEIPIGSTVRITFRDTDPFTNDLVGYYSVFSLEHEFLDDFYTLNLEHIEGDNPLADRSNALDTENTYIMDFSYENRAAGRTFNGHRTGYVPLPDSRNANHFLNAEGEFVEVDTSQGGYKGSIGYGLDTDSDILSVDTDVIANHTWVQQQIRNAEPNIIDTDRVGSNEIYNTGTEEDALTVLQDDTESANQAKIHVLQHNTRLFPLNLREDDIRINGAQIADAEAWEISGDLQVQTDSSNVPIGLYTTRVARYIGKGPGEINNLTLSREFTTAFHRGTSSDSSHYQVRGRLQCVIADTLSDIVDRNNPTLIYQTDEADWDLPDGISRDTETLVVPQVDSEDGITIKPGQYLGWRWILYAEHFNGNTEVGNLPYMVLLNSEDDPSHVLDVMNIDSQVETHALFVGTDGSIYFQKKNETPVEIIDSDGKLVDASGAIDTDDFVAGTNIDITMEGDRVRIDATNQSGDGIDTDDIFYKHSYAGAQPSMGDNAHQTLAVGHSAQGDSEGATAVGAFAKATDNRATAYGYAAEATAGNAVAIGHSSRAAHTNSIAIGDNAHTDTENQLYFGANTDRIKTAGFTGGPNQLVHVDADGNWSLDTANFDSEHAGFGIDSVLLHDNNTIAVDDTVIADHTYVQAQINAAKIPETFDTERSDRNALIRAIDVDGTFSFRQVRDAQETRTNVNFNNRHTYYVPLHLEGSEFVIISTVDAFDDGWSVHEFGDEGPVDGHGYGNTSVIRYDGPGSAKIHVPQGTTRATFTRHNGPGDSRFQLTGRLQFIRWHGNGQADGFLDDIYNGSSGNIEVIQQTDEGVWNLPAGGVDSVEQTLNWTAIDRNANHTIKNGEYLLWRWVLHADHFDYDESYGENGPTMEARSNAHDIDNHVVHYGSADALTEESTLFIGEDNGVYWHDFVNDSERTLVSPEGYAEVKLLGSGTPTDANVLHGDGTWRPVSGNSGGINGVGHLMDTEVYNTEIIVGVDTDAFNAAVDARVGTGNVTAGTGLTFDSFSLNSDTDHSLAVDETVIATRQYVTEELTAADTLLQNQIDQLDSDLKAYVPGFGIDENLFENDTEIAVDDTIIATLAAVDQKIHDASIPPITDTDRSVLNELINVESRDETVAFHQSDTDTNNYAYMEYDAFSTVNFPVNVQTSDIIINGSVPGSTPNWTDTDFTAHDGGNVGQALYTTKILRYQGKTHAPLKVNAGTVRTGFHRGGGASDSLYQLTGRVVVFIAKRLEDVISRNNPTIVAQSSEHTITLNSGTNEAHVDFVFTEVDYDRNFTVQPGDYVGLRWIFHLDHFDRNVPDDNRPYVVLADGTATNSLIETISNTPESALYIHTDNTVRYEHSVGNLDVVVIDSEGKLAADHKYFAVSSTAANATAGSGETNNSVAIGPNSNADANRAVSMGYSVNNHSGATPAASSVGIGDEALSTGSHSVAIGPFAEATEDSTIAIGRNTNVDVSHNESIALGRDAETTKANQLRIGSITEVLMDTDYAVGSDYVLATKKYVDENSGSDLTAGNGIDITSDVVSVDTDVIADTEWVIDNSARDISVVVATDQVQLSRSQAGITSVDVLVQGGYGINPETGNGHLELLVDTEVIADTDWVKTHVAGAHGVTNIVNNVADTDSIRVSIDYASDPDTILNLGNLDVGLYGQNDGGILSINVDTETIATRSYVDNHSGGNANLVAGTGLTKVNDTEIAVDTDKIADTDWVNQKFVSTTDVVFTSGFLPTKSIQFQDGNGSTNDSIFLTDGLGVTWTTTSSSNLGLDVDTDVIADTEWVKANTIRTTSSNDGVLTITDGEGNETEFHPGNGRLLLGDGLDYQHSFGFNGNSTADNTLSIDTDIIADTEWVKAEIANADYIDSEGVINLIGINYGINVPPVNLRDTDVTPSYYGSLLNIVNLNTHYVFSLPLNETEAPANIGGDEFVGGTLIVEQISNTDSDVVVNTGYYTFQTGFTQGSNLTLQYRANPFSGTDVVVNTGGVGRFRVYVTRTPMADDFSAGSYLNKGGNFVNIANTLAGDGLVSDGTSLSIPHVKIDTADSSDPAEAGGINAIAIGANSNATQEDSLAVGNNAESRHTNSIAIGHNALTTKEDQLVIGSSSGSEAIINILTPGFAPDSGIQYIRVDSDGEWQLTAAAGSAVAGFGLDETGSTWTVDTDVIADTDWVKQNVGFDIISTFNNNELDVQLRNESGTEIGSSRKLLEFTENVAVQGADRIVRITSAASFIEGDNVSISDSDDGSGYNKIKITATGGGGGGDSYINGYGLDLSGNRFSVDTDVIADTEWVKENLAANIVASQNGNMAQVTLIKGDGTFATDVLRLDPVYGLDLVVDTSIPGIDDIQFRIDTDVIADTEWVKDYVTNNAENDNFKSNFSSGVASATGTSSIAIGGGSSGNTTSAGNESIAIGNSVEAAGTGAIAIGDRAHTDTEYAIAIGYQTNTGATNIGESGVAIGYQSRSQGAMSTAVGPASAADGSHSVAVGRGANGDNSNSIAVGAGAISQHDNSIVLGASIASTDSEQLVVGGVSRIRTPNFIGGSNRFITVDANGNWTTALTPGGGGGITYDTGSGIQFTGADSDVIAIRRARFDDNSSSGLEFFSDGGVFVDLSNAWSGIFRDTDGLRVDVGYGLAQEADNELGVDTEVIADRNWVQSDYANELDYALLNTANPTYSNNVNVGVGQAYLVQNTNGHTLVYVHEPHEDNLHHRFIKVTDNGTGTYSIYQVKYTNTFQGGNATEFVCVSMPIYNSGASEVDQDASTFVIEANGDNSISIGYGLTHGSTGSVEVDTDVIADTEWVKAQGYIEGKFFAAGPTDSDAVATGNDALAMGDNAMASESGAAIGGQSVAGYRAIAIGQGSADTDYGTAIGWRSGSYGGIPMGYRATCIGAFSRAGENATAIGVSAQADGDNSYALGRFANSDGSHAIAVGRAAEAEGDYSIAIGAGLNGDTDDSPIASGNDAIAIGRNTSATGNNSVAIGHGSLVTNHNQMSFSGGELTHVKFPQVADETARDALGLSGTADLGSVVYVRNSNIMYVLTGNGWRAMNSGT